MPYERTIRSLRPGEQIPTGAPYRYPNRAGYIRLRWKVGVGQYVETLEHRVDGDRVTTSPHVHHIDHDPSNNHPTNLVPTTPSDHRVFHRNIDRREVVRLYQSGLSTPQVGHQLECDAAQVYRILIAEGITPRTISESLRLDLDETLITDLHQAGVRSRRIANLLGVSSGVIDKTVLRLGLTPHRDGRPTNDETRQAKQAIEHLMAVGLS